MKTRVFELGRRQRRVASLTAPYPRHLEKALWRFCKYFHMFLKDRTNVLEAAVILGLAWDPGLVPGVDPVLVLVFGPGLVLARVLFSTVRQNWRAKTSAATYGAPFGAHAGPKCGPYGSHMGPAWANMTAHPGEGGVMSMAMAMTWPCPLANRV